MTTSKIGWIGLGKMGIPMSENLAKAGYPVTVFNRSKDKEEAMKARGFATASSPADLIRQSDTIIIMVTDDKAIDEVFNGENGLAGANATGKAIINMSTVSPAISKKMSSLCKQQGNDYLDAPVSGSVKQATDAQLIIIAGGDETAFEKAKPLFAAMGKLAMRVGDTGAGNSAKLVVNSLLAVYAQGLAEAVLFAKNNGVRTEDLMTLLNNSAIGNVFTKIKGDLIIGDNYQAAFALKHIVKDLRLAKDLGSVTPLAKTALETFEAAAPAHGEEDMIAVFKELSSNYPYKKA